MVAPCRKTDKNGAESRQLKYVIVPEAIAAILAAFILVLVKYLREEPTAQFFCSDQALADAEGSPV